MGRAESASNSKVHANQALRTTGMLFGALVVAAVVAGVQWNSTASWADTRNTAQRQLAQMQDDSSAILRLRNAPVSAAQRVRPVESLLAQIEQALAAAHIHRERWTDSMPLPPRRERGSEYRVHGGRFSLKEVTMKELVAFNHALVQGDSALRVVGLHLTDREKETGTFDAEVVVAYCVYVPEAEHVR